MSSYRLTAEGENYLKNGLPEENLVELINAQPRKEIAIAKAVIKIKNFPIALKWSLEKGWVFKLGNVLALSKPPPYKSVEEIGLKNISKGKDIDESALKILLERNLVERITETYKETELAILKSGNVIDELTHDIMRTGLWKGRKFKSVNVEAIERKIDTRKISPGKRQPYNHFLMKVRRKLVEMGFVEMTGPTIELEFWNFDALYQPQNHPARDWTQTYSIAGSKYGFLPKKQIVEQVKAAHENGWKTGSTGWRYKWDPKKAAQLMPRAHDTVISPRYMTRGIKIPGKYFSLVRCYRPDVIDAKHGVEFYQMGGIVVGEGLTFRNLLGLLKQFVEEISGIKKVKFATGYFPFTEPSCEVLGEHPELGWIELAGAGIFRPELTLPLGVKEPVIAWGFGVDRLAMHALKINDIRELFTRNLEWLRQQKVV